MASLKLFLERVAPILEVTPAALYERQRALVGLGVLTAIEGRGRGSGVPFTADNFAAVLISVLATDSLSEVDERVSVLCDAHPVTTQTYQLISPKLWREKGSPTFKTEVGRVLSGKPPAWRASEEREGPFGHCIRVSRVWRGQIVTSPSGADPLTFIHDNRFRMVPGGKLFYPRKGRISLTAEIESETLQRLVDITVGALAAIEEDEE
jgi:hypothetical protein